MTNSLIYVPRGPAREYSELACNIYRGCEHGCTYCYGPGVLHMTLDNFHNGREREEDFIGRLERDAEALSHTYGNTTPPRVLLCFTTDPYQPINDDSGLTRKVIRILHANRFPVSVLSKGGLRARPDLPMFYPADSYGATLTFDNNEDSWSWEPGAVNPTERIETLELFHYAGIPTFASCEPVIFPYQTINLIVMSHRAVDGFKIGKLNHNKKTEEKIDWVKFGGTAIKTLEEYGYRRVTNPDHMALANSTNRLYYIKHDLLKEMENGNKPESVKKS